MRSGWPSEDGRGTPSASQGRVPFGPEISWPGGYPNAEFADARYRYASPQAVPLPSAYSGSHPYGAFNGPGAGYGDDGYSNPGYQGPAAQDAGIAGTRTVQGRLEGRQGNYPPAGYARSSYLPAAPTTAQPPPTTVQRMVPPAPTTVQRRPGYAGSSYAGNGVEMAYPPPATSAHSADLYGQPWNYELPLRYDGEEVSYRDYNGSEYSMPGVDGPGYDLSGIIGTSDFEAMGYDEPDYGRLSYDDPRYADAPQSPRPGQRFDETQLDELWQAGEDVRRESGPQPRFGNQLSGPQPRPGFGNRQSGPQQRPGSGNRQSGAQPRPGAGMGGARETTSRSVSPTGTGGGGAARQADTRYDMKALHETGANTRFDMRALAEPQGGAGFGGPRFDETRLDDMRALGKAASGELRKTGATIVAPTAANPRRWADDTSLDHFADLDLTDEPVPSAFAPRTLGRPGSVPFELPGGQDDDAATRRAVGKRRGRSGDRRQWMALGAIAVVAAGAIGGVLMKYVFAGPSGPAHSVVAPQSADGFSRSANLEKQMNVAEEAQSVAKSSSGQASDVRYGVYQKGGGGLAAASSTQMFMFVGGKLAGADPNASVTNFEQQYPGAKAVSPGSLGGQEACTQTTVNGESASMCVWFDNDTFGAMVSPTMTTAKLANTMNEVRPNLELVQK